MKVYIFKNAWKNIVRNKGRNILIGIIIVVIAAATSVTLAISNTSKKLIDSYKNSQQVEATISVNREKMREQMKPPTDGESFEDMKDQMSDNFRETSKISEDDIKKYGDSKYVTSYYYTLSTGVNSNITKVSASSKMPSMPGGMGFGGKEDFRMGSSSSDFTIVGYSSIDAMTDFIEGNYKISSGQVFEDFSKNQCIINSELAEANSLSVGDSITIIDPNNEDITMSLEITGIYDDKSTSQDNAMSMFSNSANQIITSSTVVNNFTSEDSDMSVTTTPTFILKDSTVIDKFTKEVENKGLNESLTVSTNLEKVESSLSTISNVKTFAESFLIITLIIGVVVLFVINMINIRERKYEIGVLRTIGMKKSMLCFQFMTELLIITIAALVIGAGIGAAASVPVSNSLLKNEIESSSTQKEDMKNNFGRDFSGGPPNMPGSSDSSNKSSKSSNGDMPTRGMKSVQAYDSIDAAVDFKVLLELLGIGIILSLVSSSASMIAIERFQPLEILKERS